MVPICAISSSAKELIFINTATMKIDSTLTLPAAPTGIKDKSNRRCANRAKITYQAHVQSYGWMPPVSNGGIAGTTGQSLRIEALKITLSGIPGYEVQYRAQVQCKDWLPWQTTPNGTAITSSALAGTTGQSLRLEALEVKIVKIP